MSPASDHKAGRHLGFPRVSGDEPILHAELIAIYKFSPRERG